MDDLINHVHDHKINIPIKGINDELIELNSEEFILEPMYFKWGFSESNKIEMRISVLERLRKAKRLLPKGYNFKIWDAYRPLNVQKIVYNNYFKELKNKYPDLSENKLCQMTEIFVSPASFNPLFPSPHNTGAAIDLTIVDQNKNELEMGTCFDEFNKKSFTDYFSKNPENKFNKNRMFFKELMESVGFANYFEEWWHFSYGDQEWAKTKEKKGALYGSVEL